MTFSASTYAGLALAYNPFPVFRTHQGSQQTTTGTATLDTEGSGRSTVKHQRIAVMLYYDNAL